MITQPDKAFILGGTYRVPVMAGMLPRDFVADLRREGSFNEASFDREYGSKWTGTAEDAFFDGEKFDRNRVLLQPETEFSARSSKLAYYVMAVDVGRKGCQSVITVFKVTPQTQGQSIKSVVNIFAVKDAHFED